MKIFRIENLFLIPIFLVILISIDHLILFFDLTNESFWAKYLSLAIEIFALSSIIAISTIKNIKISVYFLFFIVVIVQFIGNIFYSFYSIKESGELFLSFKDFFGIFYSAENFESENEFNKFVKMFLSFFAGGIIPLLSLFSLNFYSKYIEENRKKEEIKNNDLENKEKKAENKVQNLFEIVPNINNLNKEYTTDNYDKNEPIEELNDNVKIEKKEEIIKNLKTRINDIKKELKLKEKNNKENEIENKDKINNKQSDVKENIIITKR